MKRCVDSGMWVPDASDLEKANAEGGADAEGAAANTADDEEEIYEDASSSPSKP